MSGKLMSEVWELDLLPAEARVLQVLCDHAEHIPGTMVGINTFPAINTICWKTNYKRRHVQRTLRRLETLLIAVQVATSAPGQPVKYEIHLENAKRKAPMARRKPRYGRTIDAHDGRTIDAHGGRTIDAASPGPPSGPDAARNVVSRPPAMRSPDHTNLPLTTNEPSPVSPSSSFPQISDDDERQYVTGILEIFGKLPGTTVRPQIDIPVARVFWRNQVPKKHVEAGLWLGAARRLKRSYDFKTPVEPIASLAYFLPIVSEIAISPPSDSYTSYLRQKVELGKVELGRIDLGGKL